MNRINIICAVFFLNIVFPISGSGQINFIDHQITDNTDGIACAFACDLDNDLDQDIIAASNKDNQIIWFRNDGGDTIKWTKIVVAYNVYSAHSVYAADIDGDSALDCIERLI